MFEQLNNYFYIITIYFPLGIVGLWRWSVWMMKKIVALRYRPIAENEYTNSLSIVVPVYNEDPALFQQALDSWEANNPDEIIAVIDHSDERCIEVFRKFQQTHTASRLIVTRRPGKREALSDGIQAAQYNIIALVDSDTVWKPNIKNLLLAPFRDSSIGGVGPRQDVLDTNTIARRLFNIHIDQRYYDEMTYLATVADSLTCISGRTALYRAEAIKDLCYELENETFMGVKCISGDDKCLTRLVQQKGWKVRYQSNALVLTPGAAGYLTLLKQQMRWTRNSYRSDLKSLTSKWIWKNEKFLAFHMIDRFTQPFTLVLGPIYFIFSIIWGYWLAAGILLVWWHFSRGVKLFAHLRHRPSDILILPIYIVTTYVLAVLKIYAMVTLRKQGWITRWDKDRLYSRGRYAVKIFKSSLSYLTTVFILLFLSVVVVNYKNIVFADENHFIPIVKKPSPSVERIHFSDVTTIDTATPRQSIIDSFVSGQVGYYIVRKKDTLVNIASKYNSDLSVIIAANRNTIPNPDAIEIGQKVIIPLTELRNTLTKDDLLYYGRPHVTFNAPDNSIIITGEGSVVTLSSMYRLLGYTGVLEKLDNKEWIVRANVLIKDGVTLLIDGDEVSWLKLKSDKSGFVSLYSFNGTIVINNTKITSWNEQKKAPDDVYQDGRSFILAQQNGRMDIVNSELAFLGYAADGREGEPTGGIYGVSWKISNGNIRKDLITGNVFGSMFHNNYFGVYTSGATGMVFNNNKLYDNILYGLDLHDYSNNFIIENNTASNNGSHGIIMSKGCFNNIVRNNVSHGNKLHGIMLHEQSNNNNLQHNIVYDNVDGIAIYASHNNLVLYNEIKANKNGIRLNVGSSGNYIEQNKILHNKNGIFLYDNANNNVVDSNTITYNIKGVYIKNASGNIIKNSLKRGSNQTEIKLNTGISTGTPVNFIQKVK